MKLEGSLTVEYSGKLKTSLLETLNIAKDREIDISGIEMIDLAGMQVLISLAKEFQKRTIPVRFAGELRPLVRKCLLEAGFIQLSPEGFISFSMESNA